MAGTVSAEAIAPPTFAPVHSADYRLRRFLNWFPLGLAYAFLYMGRYNLTVAKNLLGDLMPVEAFGNIFGTGAIVYGCAFVLNGPLTDRIGGRRAMLIALLGAAAANLGMGVYVRSALHLADPRSAQVVPVMTVLYALNMYFQSYGAVAIVKVNATWFHVRERGGFSGIFGAMISSGIFFAWDVNQRIVDHLALASKGGVVPSWDVFFAPSACLFAILLIEALILRDRPSQAGHADFETGDASAGEDERAVPMLEILRRIVTNPVIITVALIEFCTGALRDGTTHWFKIFAGQEVAALRAAGIDPGGSGPAFALKYEGLILMGAGIIGGNFAGWISDKVFHSRRAPAAGLLYVLLLACALALNVALSNAWAQAAIVFLIAIGVLGTHGMLSGTATMDFGGRKGAGTAVGLIDGFVYLGVATQSFALGHLVRGATVKVVDGALVASGWERWPMFLVPFSAIGLVLLGRIWHAMPSRRPRGG